MSVDVICPECGGIVGGDTAASGRGPCTCEKSSDRRYAAPRTSDAPPPPPPSMEDRGDVGGEQKICIVCGKDVAGHRRIKDSRGYTCYNCVKAERANELEGTTPCAECGRRVREQGLVEYNGLIICRKCHIEHLETNKHKVKQIKTAQFEKHEKKNIILLSIVVAALGLIVLWQQLKH